MLRDDRFIHDRANILGINVSAINMAKAVELAELCISTGNRGYVCVTGVHGVMEAQHAPDLRAILNEAFINTPDGMPMSWVGRLQGFKSMGRVYGPDFMAEMCRISTQRSYTHFLYGGNEGVAELLAKRLADRFVGCRIVGTYTPPFRPLNASEEENLHRIVNAAKPDVFWIGLSTPKQERFMARYIDTLDVKLMVGVGAAFDIHTGRIKDAPAWMKLGGLQWLHRLLQEPKRLGPRYLTNNPRFLWSIARQFLRAPRDRNSVTYKLP